MKNLGAKVTNYMDQAINKLETVLEQVDKGIGRTANALDLVEQDIFTTVKKDLRTFRKGIKLFARLLNVVFTATFLLVLYLKFTQPDIYADLVRVMSKIMNGARAINAIELHKISEYLHVSMDSLMKLPEKPMDTNVMHAFTGRVKTEEARKGIQLADKLSDMILFHSRVCENGKKMDQPWEDK